MPCTMISTVVVLFNFNSFKKVMLTLLLIELIVWQFLGLSWLMYWI